MINTWNESLLHEELKDYYCGQDGSTEVPVDGSICDAVLKNGTIVEIQTAHLSKLKPKLEKLLVARAVNLVYPIAVNTWIETFNADGTLKSRRKSPKHGSIYALFREMTGIWHLVENPNLTVTVVLADILELRVADGSGTWRHKGVRKDDRKLLKIHATREFHSLIDYIDLIPANLGEPFSVKQLQESGAGTSAGYMAWVLRKCGAIAIAGKKGNALLYRRCYIKTGNEMETLVPAPGAEETNTLP